MVCLGYCAGSSWFAVMAELELKNDSDTPEAKKALISPKIGTHNGTFHCDEALACFMLKQLPQYRLADIVRTRNQEELANCDIVVDVGGVYDADKHRYDHHQRYVDVKLSVIEEIERLKKFEVKNFPFLVICFSCMTCILPSFVWMFLRVT